MNQNLLYGIVLLSAVGHASWNALLKGTSDRLVIMVAIRAVGLFYGFILLWCAGRPSIENLKWVIAAAAAMWIYQALLVQGYHFGDLSFVYPLARGVAPVISTVLAFLLIADSGRCRPAMRNDRAPGSGMMAPGHSEMMAPTRPK